MKYNISAETKRRIGHLLGNILLYILVIYTFYMLGRSVWNNFILQKQITNIQNQIVATQKNNKDLQNLIVYYQSDSFREVQARSKLGLKKPGEVVVDVPVKKIDNFNSEIENQVQGLNVDKPSEAISNYQLWWQYLTQ